MKKFLFFILIPLFLFPQEKKLTLEQCLEMGLKNSKELKISKSKVISSEAKESEITSALLPQLKLNAGYTRLSNVDPFRIIVPFSPVPIQISDIILDNYNIKISMTQPLFTGFRLWNLKEAASLNAQAQRIDLLKNNSDVAFNIIVAYWNYYKALLLKEMFKENLKQLNKHIENTEQFFKNSLVNKNDLLKIQVQASNIKLQLIEAENNVDIARMLLNKEIGINISAPTEIEIKNIQMDLEAPVSKDNIDNALTQRDEINSLKLRLSASEKNLNSTLAGWLPSIFLFGNFYYNKPNQRYQPLINKFKTTWDIGVTLNWDIWNWGLTSSQITQAREQKFQLETSLEQLKENIEVEINYADLSLNRSKEKFEVCKLTLEQAQENLRIINEKYLQQLVSSTDLIDAEYSFLQAKINYTNSMIEYEVSRIKLIKAKGGNIY